MIIVRVINVRDDLKSPVITSGKLDTVQVGIDGLCVNKDKCLQDGHKNYFVLQCGA